MRRSPSNRSCSVRSSAGAVALAALIFSLSSCGTSHAGQAQDLGVKRSDYYALCDTHSGKFGNAVSDHFRTLPDDVQDQARELVYEDPSCQPDEE